MAAKKREDNELVTERVFDAPRELVYAVWTNPKHLASWWGPRGFSTTTHAIEVKKGGAWRFTMHGPDGTDYPNRIDFLEVVPSERLHYDHGQDDGKPPHFQATVTFSDEKGGTRVSLRLKVPSAEARAAFVKFGAVEGGQQTLERFGEQLQTMMPKHDVVVTRLFDAPRALVFEAWTTPDHLKHWFAPKGYSSPAVEMEFAPGGSYRHLFRSQSGEHKQWFHGVYREIVENEKIVMSAILDDHPHMEMLTVVNFEDEGEKTRVTVRHSLIDNEVTRGAEIGWSSTLENLAAYLAR